MLKSNSNLTRRNKGFWVGKACPERSRRIWFSERSGEKGDIRKISFLWLFIAVTLMLTNIGIAQDKDQNPREQQRAAEQRRRAGRERLNIFIMRSLDSLLERVGESVG